MYFDQKYLFLRTWIWNRNGFRTIKYFASNTSKHLLCRIIYQLDRVDDV